VRRKAIDKLALRGARVLPLVDHHLDEALGKAIRPTPCFCAA
jgi:hypothetical protein